MSTYTEINMLKHKCKLLVKRPCDSKYFIFVESKDLKIIKHGFYVAHRYGWKSKIEF